MNIGNGNVIGNRPAWDQGDWGNEGWGLDGGNWNDHWHDNCINDHHDWYNGCWDGYWGGDWYEPIGWAAAGWGLGAVASNWGYGTGYYNPYYETPVATVETVPYDYSQPVVVNNYVSSDAEAAGGEAQPVQVQETPESKAMQLFDAGLEQFQGGKYQQALASFDAALKKLPGDPVVHEVRALTLFALGDYKKAAVALNSLLSSAPGMDWTTMSSLYGNDDDYTAQLRKLEAYCKANPKDAAAAFVLAYHYLTLDEKDAAVDMLRVVVANQPKDTTAKRMLDALAPPETAASPTPGVPSPPQPTPDANAPQTDLVGTWQAKAGNATIDLTIGEDSQFTWKARQAGKPTVELKGLLRSTGDQIMLENSKQGSISGAVKSGGSDQWHFAVSGAPASDSGLTFVRKKS